MPRLNLRGGYSTLVGERRSVSLAGTLLASAAAAISVAAATPAALADGLTFTNKTISNGLGNNNVRGVYASGSSIYAATNTTNGTTNGTGGGLSISTDGGTSWTNYTNTNGLGSNNVFGVYASDGNVYAATAGGLSISTNGGTSWTNYTTDNGLGSNNVFGVYASGSTIYAATQGGLSIAQQSDPTPSAVPGPLPLFGAASAFGFSRRLRSRLRSHSGAVAPAAQA